MGLTNKLKKENDRQSSWNLEGDAHERVDWTSKTWYRTGVKSATRIVIHNV